MRYRLDDLGWFQFERLCQALLRVAYGARLETWGGSGDTGKDAYAQGPLAYPDAKVANSGPFVFQVKFVAAANAAGSRPATSLLSAIRTEAALIEERVTDGTWEKPAFFTLMPNVTLAPRIRQQISQILLPVLPHCEVLLTGARELEAMLDSQPHIRTSYPQILGLRDLKALLRDTVSAAIVNRSTLTLESSSRLARVFVPTEAYARTLSALTGRGFAVLTGPPEMGKTATARMIAFAKFCSGWEAFECRNPDELFKMYDRERSQVFLADDAFGSTEYRPDIAVEWAAVLDRLIDLADHRHNILWTSRPGPLKEGLRQLHLQGSARDFPKPSEIQVDASRLTVPEKAQILYRHAKAAKLEAEATRLIRAHAWQIVMNPHFTPLRIERFVSEQLLEIMASPPQRRNTLLVAAISHGMQTPTQAMRTSFERLGEEHKAMMFAMLSLSQGRIDLRDVKKLMEQFLGRPLSLSVEKLADLLGEHFIRVEAPRSFVLGG